MAKKTEIKSERIEREYIIPVREQINKVPRYKKTNKAVRTIKEFLVRHMKIRDRDLRKVKIDKYLNEYLWHRGIKHPPHKVKVKAVREGDIVTVELAEYPQNLKFKKLREEKVRKVAREAVEKKKTLMEKAKESITKTETPKEETETKQTETAEKEKTSAEATQLLEKEMAKKEKHNSEMRPKMEEKSREKKVYDKTNRGR